MNYNPSEELENEITGEEVGDEEEKQETQSLKKNSLGGEGANDDGNNQEDPEQTEDADRKSVYVKNVDYSSTKEDLSDHFKECGKIVRITILSDKFTGNPKGYAYIEFESLEGAEDAKKLNDSILNGRQIQVLPKRTNKPFRGGKRGVRRGRGSFRGMGPPSYRGYHMFSGRGYRRGYRPY